MKKIIERVLIKILKTMNVNLLSHAHVQIGVGHNSYQSGEDFIVNNVIEELLQGEPKVIFDVGANIGEYTKMLSDRFVNATIHSFEPILATFLILKKNTINLNAKLNNFGLGEKEEELEMYVGKENQNNAMATLYPEAMSSIFTFEQIEIEPVKYAFTTLHLYCDHNKTKTIDF